MISNVPVPAMTYIFMGITTLVLTYITFLDDGSSEEKTEEEINPEQVAASKEEPIESEYYAQEPEPELEPELEPEPEPEEYNNQTENPNETETDNEKKRSIQGGKKNRTKINKVNKNKKTNTKKTIKNTNKIK
jgi:hypothetical protein